MGAGKTVVGRFRVWEFILAACGRSCSAGIDLSAIFNQASELIMTAPIRWTASEISSHR
jgi:hypothetical protein